MSINNSDRILVTGGTGFIGAYVIRDLLQKGFTNIHAIKRASSPTEMIQDFYDQVQWSECGLLETASLDKIIQNVDAIIHCAAIISLNPSDRKMMYRINVEGTANIVNLALTHQLKKVIHISSIAAIGRPLKSETITEETEWVDSEFNSHYGISKYQAELELRRGQLEGLDIGIINPGLVLGAGYWDSGTASIIKRVDKGIPFYPLGSNGLVDVRDVAKASVILLQSEIVGERYIISGQNLSYRELFNSIAEALGKSGPKRPFKAWLGALAWRVEWLRSKITGADILVSRESLSTTAYPAQYDNSKSIAELGMKYRDIRASIIEISAIYKASKEQGHGRLPS